MATPMTEDELFPLWQASSGFEKEELTRQLAKLLTRHANAIVYLTLGKPYQEPVNEAVYRALTRSDSFRGESKFSTWFHAITYRICMDYSRKQPKGEVVLDENLLGTSPEDEIIEKVDLERSVGKLTSREQELVEFRRIGLSNREVAEKFGVDDSTVHYWWEKIWEKMQCLI